MGSKLGGKTSPKALASSPNVDLFNEQCHTLETFWNRQKQVSVDRFWVKLPKSESPTVFSEDKRQKTEETPEKLLEIVLEEDSSCNN